MKFNHCFLLPATLLSAIPLSLTYISLCASPAYAMEGGSLNPDHRPQDLKEEIHTTFKSVSRGGKSWNYNGSQYYTFIGLDTHKLLKAIINSQHKNQKEFYVLDIGAGDFSWGNAIVKYINEEIDLPEDIIIHVISVTGDSYTNIVPSKKIGHCIQYNIDRFKAEDLSNAFKEKGFDLDQKIDMVVSSKFFLHLHDPAGTFIQAYNLLRPGTGIILSDGFPIFYGNEQKQNLVMNMLEFLIDTSKPFLIQSADQGGNIILPFLMRRTDAAPLTPSLQYAGMTRKKLANTDEKNIVYFYKLPEFHSKKITWEDVAFPANAEVGKYFGDKELYLWIHNIYPVWQNIDTSWQPILKEPTNQKIENKPLSIVKAVNNCDIELTKSLLDEKPDSINSKDDEGSPLLHTALYCKPKFLEFMLGQPRLDINAKNSKGDPILKKFQASENFLILLGHGKDLNLNLNSIDKDGNTVAHTMAAYFPPRAILENFQSLLKAHPNVNLQNKEGNTPLHLAILRFTNYSPDSFKIIDLLLQGSNMSIKNHAGNTPLHLAVEAYHKLPSLPPHKKHLKKSIEEILPKFQNTIKKLIKENPALKDIQNNQGDSVSSLIEYRGLKDELEG